MKRIAFLWLVCIMLLAGCAPKVEVMTWQEQYDLGIRYLSEGNYEEAILAFTAAIEIDPMQKDAYISLAETYMEVGEGEKAREVLEKAVSALGDIAELQELLDAILSDGITVQFEPCDYYTSEKEYATITATDKTGAVLWNLKTDEHEWAQCSSVCGIGTWRNRYYYIDYPAIVAVNMRSGEELWRNEEYSGAATGGFLIGDDGCVYAAGYLGPDFFAVDKKGQTLKRIEQFDPEERYYWPDKIEQNGEFLEVTLTGGPSGYQGNGESYVFTVDLKDFSYTYPKNVFDVMTDMARAAEVAEMVSRYCNENWDAENGEFTVFDTEVYENGDGSAYWVIVRKNPDPNDEFAMYKANQYYADLLIDAQTGAVSHKYDEQQSIEGYLW